MVWGWRSGHLLGLSLLAFTSIGSGCGSNGGSKSHAQCRSTEVEVCDDQGLNHRCVCQPGGASGASGSGADGGGPAAGGTSGGPGVIGAGGGPPPFGGSSGVGGAGGVNGVGGVGGLGGSAATGAVAGSGGALGAGGAVGNSRLGAACVGDVDCGAGLICILSTSAELGGGGPAMGICTADCSASSAACASLDPNAICLGFGTGAAYCMQSCSFGPPGASANPNKCRGRDEVACSPLYGATGRPCTTNANCSIGETCDVGECFSIIPGCVPQCNSDADCGTGRYCNPADGLCYGTPKSGLLTGQTCVEPAAGAPDSCRGTCIGLTDSSGGPALAHVCADRCTLGAFPSCGWAGPASNTAAEALCVFSALEYPGAGDQGSCAQLCNCNADCRNPALVCLPIGNASLEQATRRRGFCSLAAGSPGLPCP